MDGFVAWLTSFYVDRTSFMMTGSYVDAACL